MKKKLSLLTTVLLSGIISSSVFAQDFQKVVKIAIDSNTASVLGKDVEIDAPAYISSGNTMVPLRFISNSLGVADEDIYYDSSEQAIKIAYKDRIFTFKQGQNEFTITRSDSTTEILKMNNNAVIETKNGSSFIPFRVLETLFDVEVFWDSTSRTAILIDNSYTPSTEILTEVSTETTSETTSETASETTSETTSISEETTQNFVEDFSETTSEDILNSSNTLDSTSDKIEGFTQTTTTQKIIIDNYRTEEQVYQLEKEVVELVNAERTKNNLVPLELSNKLVVTSRYKANDMATKDYFSHIDPSGDIWAIHLNVSENIAAGQVSAKDVVSSWLNSEAHRDNILDPNTRYIGVGYSEQSGSKYGYYWTQQFSNNDKWSDHISLEMINLNSTLNQNKLITLSEEEIISFEEELLLLINQKRSDFGLAPFILSDGLIETASQKSEDMATNNYIGHTDLNGDVFYKEIEGSSFWTIFENYAAGTTSPEEILDIWLDIDTQKEQLLSPNNKYIGISFFQDLNSEWNYYTTAHFSGNLKWTN